MLDISEDNWQYLITVFFIIGALQVLCFTYSAIKLIAYYLFRPSQDLYRIYGKKEKDGEDRSWALVTGASDGIGLGYCKELARQGFNIIMLSRSKDKLQDAAEEVKKFNDKVKIAIEVQDLSAISTYKEFETRFAFVKNYDIALLINNAGLGFNGPFTDVRTEEAQSIVGVNCLHPTYLTKFLLPQLIARPEKSGVITVSSVMGNFYCPGNLIYAASKVFVDRLFNGLTYETQNVQDIKGKVDIMTYQPGPVATKLSRMPLGIGIPSPLKAAANSLRDLGKRTVSNSIFEHDFVGKFMFFGAKWIPSIMSFSLYKRAYDLNRQLRAEGKSVY